MNNKYTIQERQKKVRKISFYLSRVISWEVIHPKTLFNQQRLIYSFMFLDSYILERGHIINKSSLGPMNSDSL